MQETSATYCGMPQPEIRLTNEIIEKSRAQHLVHMGGMFSEGNRKGSVLDSFWQHMNGLRRLPVEIEVMEYAA